jgi:hypothetical protein
MKRRGTAWRHEGAFRRGRFAAPIVAALAAAGLSGCASISQKFADTASQMPGIGLPAGTPERPSSAVAYPAVHDIPPPRNSVMLTNTEAEQLENDLATARDQQQGAVGIKPQAKKNKDQPKVVPVSSRSSIY